MPLRWFKMWTHARTNSKLQALDFKQHFAWFQLLCLAAEQEPRGTITKSHLILKVEAGFARETDEAFDEILAVLKTYMLIDFAILDDGKVTVRFPSWSKWQSEAPSSKAVPTKERVRKSRLRKKLQELESQLNVSLPEIMSIRKLSYPEYLKTDHWKAVRQRELITANGRCRLCNSDGPLDVHHRTYERLGEELPEDVLALCRPCHESHHDKAKITNDYPKINRTDIA